MNLPLHPAIVHLPLGLAFALPVVILGLAIAALRSQVNRRAWLAAVALQAILVVGGLVALRTGEADEDRVEKAVAEAAIEAHEHAAQAFLVGAGAVLALGLALLFVPAERAAKGVAVAAALASLATGGLALRTGHAGGELVYRHGAAAAWVSGAASTSPGEAARAGRHHDDDD